MEILSTKKIKNTEYELTLDNGSILKIHDDTILKYNLLIDKTIDQKKLDEITKYNDALDSYYLALKYINQKMRSTLEISKYLQKKNFDKKIIDQTIKRLQKEGYLNNEKFIESYINDQYNLTNNGPDKIKYNLIKLGFTEEEIIIDKDFTDKLKNIIIKKQKSNHKLSTNMLKQNIANYLVNLGYSKDMFIDYLDNINADDEDLIKKDYNLINKKYSRKYDSYKLKAVIKDKLYKKGYSIESINRLISEDE